MVGTAQARLPPSLLELRRTSCPPYKTTADSALADLLQLQPDGPAARQIAVAIELNGADVVVGHRATGDGQALARLDVPDLVDAAAGYIVDPPGARGVVVAVELKRHHIVIVALAAGNRQAFSSL